MLESNYLLLSDPLLWDKLNHLYGNRGGVYKMYTLQNKQPAIIGRLLGFDKTGLLYIGKAISFIDRVLSLKKSISPDYNHKGHICGRRYKSNPMIATVYPFSSLFIQLFVADDPELLEKQFLNDYFKQFGEVPPLNAI